MANIKAVSFRNIDSEPFSTKWGGVEYTFQPGEVSFFEEGIAEKFANDLMNKILMRSLPDNEITTIHGHHSRADMKHKIFGRVVEGRDRTEAFQKATAVEAPVIVREEPESPIVEDEEPADEEVVAPKKKKKATTNETSN